MLYEVHARRVMVGGGRACGCHSSEGKRTARACSTVAVRCCTMEVRLELVEDALKVFVAALQCLAQVGKELSMECDIAARCLTLRALNDARSASGQVVLARSFFIESPAGSVTLQNVAISSREALCARFGGRAPFAKCKVFAKSCCNVFRTLKHVQSVQLALLVDQEALDGADASQEAALSPRSDTANNNSNADEVDLDCLALRWTLRCAFDITKTHYMKVQSCQVMRAVFDRSACANHWRTRQHHLSSLLAHVQHSSEVSVTCSPTHVKVESYFSTGTEGKAQLQTETAVESGEFSEYVLQPAATTWGEPAGAQLIFCIKEIRALLAFCKTSDVLEVSFYYTTSGSPVLFTAESTSMAKFSIELTLSTVTTFVPASSQSCAEAEVTLCVNDTMMSTSATSQTLSQSQSSSQENPRYLTHSKRPRVED